MLTAPWYRRAAAEVMILVWNAWGALSYLSRGRRERSLLFRRFCSENGLEPPPGSEGRLHRYHRRHERCKTAFVAGIVRDDFTQVERAYDRFRIVGRDLLTSYRDRGALLVAFHVGPWSLIPGLLSRMGFDVAILARGDEMAAATGHDLAEVNRVLAERLSSHGLGSTQLVDSRGMLSLIQVKRALSRKNFVLIFPDTARSSSVSWAPVPFFRQRLAGHLGLAKLLQMTRAEVVHLVTYWDRDDRMVLEVLGPCPYPSDAPPEELLRTFYAPFEGLVSRDLSQWTQIHSYDELKYDGRMDLDPISPSA